MPKTHSKSTYNLMQLIILQVIFVFTQSALQSLPQLYIDHLQFWTTSCTAKLPSNTGYTHNFTFRSSIPNIYEIGLSNERSRRSTPNAFLSFYLRFSNSSTGINITLNPVNNGAELCYMAYSLIIITQPTKYLQIINQDLTFMLLNNRVRPDNQEFFTLSSRKFRFPVNYLTVAPFFTYLITNNLGVINQHYEIYAYPVTNTSNLLIKILNQAVFENSFISARVGVLLVDLSGYDSRIASYYYSIVVSSSGNFIFHHDFGVPNSQFGNSINGYNCLIRLHGFRAQPPFGNIQSSFEIVSFQVRRPIFGSLTTYIIQVNCWALCTAPNLILNHANSYSCVTCASTLQMPNSVYYDSTSNTCLPCSNNLPNCAICASSAICNVCYFNYFMAANQTACLSCSSFMPGCVDCFNQSICQSCIPNYFVISNQTACSICNQFIPNCDVCYNKTTCHSCFRNTSLSINQTRCINCVGYIPNCKVCYNQTICFACELNFFPTTNRSQCLPCASLIENCSLCYNSSYCVVCSRNIFFVSSNKTSCLTCSDYLPRCVTCSSQFMCTQCVNNSRIVLKVGSCEICGDVIPNCQYCNSTASCIQCIDNYFLSSDKSNCTTCAGFMPGCKKCLSQSSCQQCFVGWLVEGGCTTTAGCIAVLYSTSLCLKCNSTAFDYDEINHKCVCKAGKLVGIYCVNSQGCLTAIPVGDSFQCLSCNITRKFFYNNATKQCECLEGYTLQNDFCVDICGDGRVITNQCDDGNLVDGDGCSRLCTVEVSCNCSGGTIKSPSSCTYIGTYLQINLVDTQKTSGQNQAVFTFDVKPKLSLFSKMSLIDYFLFSCNCSSSVERWTYENGQIKLYLNYDTDIEGMNVHISFSFDQNFFKHRPIDYYFTIESNGTLLYAYHQLGKQIITRYCFLGFSFLLILITVAGSLVREMAGVELIQVLQTIYYLHYSITQYTQTISSMQYLSLVALNNLFMQEESQNYVGFRKYQKIKFSSYHAQISLIGITSFFVLSFIAKFIWSRVYQYYKMRNYKMNKPKPKEQNQPKLVDHFHSVVSFPYSLALILPTYFIISTYFIRNGIDYIYLFPTLRAILIFTSICIITFNLSKEYFNRAFYSQDQRAVIGFKAKQFYGCSYVNYQIYQLIALWLWMIKGWTFCLYIMIGGTVTMIVWQIKKKPYKLIFSNTSIFLNQFLLLSYELYLLLKSYSLLESNEKTDTIVNITFIVMMLLCSVLTTMRVFRATYNSCRNSNDENKKIVQMEIKYEQQNLLAKISCKKEKMLGKKLLKQEKKEADLQQRKYLEPKKEQKVDEELKKLIKHMKKQFYEKRRRQNQWNKPQVI